MDDPVPAFAIAFVVYRPEAALLGRIELISRLGVDIYLFDNSPGEESITNQLRKTRSLKYYSAGKNVGLGFSLSLLCATAHAEGVKTLLFLDQDTGISQRTVHFVMEFSREHLDLTERKYTAIVFDSKSIPAEPAITDVDLAISSGSLFVLANLEKVGWHNERYFVDCVDYELCIRSAVRGYKIGIAHNTPDFDHVSEQPDQHINILGRVLPVRRYSSTRIKDAIGAYLRLAIYCLRQGRPRLLAVVLKSFGIYVFGQIFARVIKIKK